MPMLRASRINTLPGLSILAFSLAILPLVVALVTSTLYVNRLSTQGQEAIHNATVIANASQRLSDSLIAMERSARQYNVLLDRDLFRLYLEHRGHFEKSLEMLRSLSLPQALMDSLNSIEEVEASIHKGLETVLLGTSESSALLSGFTVINTEAAFIRDKSRRLKEEAVSRLQQSANKANRLMVWQLAGLLPVLAFVMYMFFNRILKPIRRLERAIRQLGRGDLEAPIRVGGPRDFEELGESLDWMRQRINQLESQKTRFLQHMSHELKTPLTSLREGSDLLSEGVVGALTEDQQDIVTLIRHNCARLQEQIENLLTFSTAQSKQMLLKLTTFRLDELIREALPGHQLAIRHKNLQLVLGLGSVEVDADKEKLRMVVDNLISNAVKYSPPGGKLEIRLTQQNQSLCLVVEDEGPGIPEQERLLVFEAFYQGSVRSDNPVRGTGIGLSICKIYVESHGGEIVVDSSASGARIRILMPLQARNREYCESEATAVNVDSAISEGVSTVDER